MGSSPVLVRGSELGPLAIGVWRIGLALPILFLWAAWESRGAPWRILRLGRSAWLGGIFFAGDLAFWHLSIAHTTVANATLFATMSPIWVVIGSSFFLGE